MKIGVHYFPNLNALRFIAASMVLIGHTEQIKGFHGFKCYFLDFPFIFQGGHLAVIFFFVLSGFLITNIISRQLSADSFSVSDFYKKRIVRIWPLYYLIVLLGLFIIPQLTFMFHETDYVMKLSDMEEGDLNIVTVLFLVVLPNISLHFGTFQYLGHTWSIGVEEQFYLIWPLLMKWFKTVLLQLLLAVIFTMWIGRWLFSQLGWDNLATFMSVFRIDSMAIGGLGSYVISKSPQLSRYFVNRAIEIIALAAVMLSFGLQLQFGPVTDELYSVLFSVIILNAACNSKTVIQLERFKLLNYFGTVSYGIYMYHPITGMLSLLLFNWIHPSYMASLSSNIVFYGLVFAITLLTATLSYELVEKRIMKFGRERWLKER